MEHARRLNKRELITRHVAGLSYVDIGGLWGTKGETVTTAARAGAARVAMADIQALDSSWWQKFEAHCAVLGVEGYGKIQVDICAPDAPERVGTFDFVHCAGVMYHVADLFRFVGNLVSVTNRYLLLSSVVMPEEIRTPSGSLSFGPDHAYLSPILSEESKQIVAEHLEGKGIVADGLTKPAPYLREGRPRFAPWWWLFSGAFMSRVVRMHGLEILDEGQTPKGNAYTVFARVPAA